MKSCQDQDCDADDGDYSDDDFHIKQNWYFDKD